MVIDALILPGVCFGARFGFGRDFLATPATPTCQGEGTGVVVSRGLPAV